MYLYIFIYIHTYIIIIQKWSHLKISSQQENISIIRKIYDLIEMDPPKINKNTKEEIEIFESFIFLQSNCYKLIEILYDRSSLATIKGIFMYMYVYVHI
jgi:hypothetical protein